MILGIFGELGSGKTLFLTIMGYKYHKKGYKVYSNYKTTFSELIDYSKIVHYKLDNCVLLLDEAHTFFDSRESMSEVNRLLSYFFTQSRKRRTHIFYTSQLASAVDKRLRRITDIYVVAEKIKNGFMYTIIKDLTVKKLFLPVQKAEQYFKMYNTYEIVLPFKLKADVEKLVEIYRKAGGDKDIFIVMAQKEYPFLTKASLNVFHKLIKNNEIGKLKEILEN